MTNRSRLLWCLLGAQLFAGLCALGAQESRRRIGVAFAPVLNDVGEVITVSDGWGLGGRLSLEAPISARYAVVAALTVTLLPARYVTVPPSAFSQNLEPDRVASFSSRRSGQTDDEFAGRGEVVATSGTVAWRGYLFESSSGPFLGLGGGVAVLAARGGPSLRLQASASGGYSLRIADGVRLFGESGMDWVGLGLMTDPNKKVRPRWMIPTFLGLTFAY